LSTEQTLRKNNKKSTGAGAGAATILQQHNSSNSIGVSGKDTLRQQKKPTNPCKSDFLIWLPCLPATLCHAPMRLPFLVSLAPNKLAICCTVVGFLQFFLLHLTLVSVAPQLLFALAFSCGNNCSQGTAR